jgi:hypothetical protein
LPSDREAPRAVAQPPSRSRVGRERIEIACPRCCFGRGQFEREPRRGSHPFLTGREQSNGVHACRSPLASAPLVRALAGTRTTDRQRRHRLHLVARRLGLLRRGQLRREVQASNRSHRFRLSDPSQLRLGRGPLRRVPPAGHAQLRPPRGSGGATRGRAGRMARPCREKPLVAQRAPCSSEKGEARPDSLRRGAAAAERRGCASRAMEGRSRGPGPGLGGMARRRGRRCCSASCSFGCRRWSTSWQTTDQNSRFPPRASR